jgi:hypothetical protein
MPTLCFTNVGRCWCPQCEELLREGLMLKVALEAPLPSSTLEKLLPKRVKQFQRGVEQKA